MNVKEQRFVHVQDSRCTKTSTTKGSGVGMPHGINIEESQWHFHKNYKAIEPLHVMKQIVMGDTAMNKQMEDRILLYVGIDVENAIAEAMQ